MFFRRFAASVALAVVVVAGSALAGEPLPFKGSLEGRHVSRTPVNPLAARTLCSASVIVSGSLDRNSTRQVVHRAFPPHA